MNKRGLSPIILLEVEPVPTTMWGRNVRSVISRESWEVLRWLFRASICKPQFVGSKGIDVSDRYSVADVMFSGEEIVLCRKCRCAREELELHEVWQYDDVRRIQRLTTLVPLCMTCHAAVHLGRAMQLGNEGPAITHLSLVNGWNERQTEAHIEQAFRRWRERSAHHYTLDLTWLYTVVPKNMVHLNWLDEPRNFVNDSFTAIEWARQRLASDALIVDTETTGLLQHPKAEVIEMAILDMKGRLLYESLFRPKFPIPQRTIEIHAISAKDVHRAPTFDVEHERIAAILKGRTVIAYKAQFDQGMLRRTSHFYRLPPPDCRWECAMWNYKYFLASSQFQKLPFSRHRARADAKAILRLMKVMAE